jgi:hypothetical protein
MRTGRLAGAILPLALAGCVQGGAGSPPSLPRQPAVPTQGTSTTAAGTVLADFDLYTHCGVRETRIGTGYYLADRVLDDGQGNPPPEWGNPFQRGTMTVHPDGTAIFTAGRLHARFVLRRGATTWLQICS